MPETKCALIAIQNLEVKQKIQVDKEDGIVVDKRVVTTVKFECEGNAAKLTNILYAMTSDHQIDVVFSSAQLSMDLDEKQLVEATEVE